MVRYIYSFVVFMLTVNTGFSQTKEFNLAFIDKVISLNEIDCKEYMDYKHFSILNRFELGAIVSLESILPNQAYTE